MSNVFSIKTKKSVDYVPTAIKDCGSHFKVFVPSCYKYQTIDHTEVHIAYWEPGEPSLKERLDAVDTLPKVVEIVEYRLGHLNEYV